MTTVQNDSGNLELGIGDTMRKGKANLALEVVDSSVVELSSFDDLMVKIFDRRTSTVFKGRSTAHMSSNPASSRIMMIVVFDWGSFVLFVLFNSFFLAHHEFLFLLTINLFSQYHLLTRL